MGQSRTDPLACLACGLAGHFTSPDDADAGVGSVVICGACGELHVLGARQEYVPALDELTWVPYLRRPVLEELEALRARPEVKALLDAYELAAMERRLARAARKGPKVGKGLQLVDGGKLKLEGHGPGYRGPHLL